MNTSHYETETGSRAHCGIGLGFDSVARIALIGAASIVIVGGFLVALQIAQEFAP